MEKFSWCDFVAGWTGGILGLAVGHPLDTLKVRQQTIPGGGGIMELAKSTYKIEGVRGFFKGLSYPLWGAGIYNALFFGVYGNSLRYLQGPNVDRKMCCEGGPVNDRWHWDVFVAGCIGGVATVLYSCPLELIKIKLQAQTATLPTRNVSVCKQLCRSEPIYTGPFDALKTIYKKYGIYRGLYKGTITMMWRDVPTFGLYTVSYEHLLCMLRDKDDRSSGSTVTAQFIAGGIAGLLSWIVVVPVDVVKSRIQADDFGAPVYKGMIDCMKKSYHQDGLKSLFLGTTLMCIRAFPVNAATFIGYEWVISILSTTVVMPLDVVKTRIQFDHFKFPVYSGAIDCFIKMYRKEGVKSLFIGLRIGLIRAFPTNAVRFVAYEYVLNKCELWRTASGSPEPVEENRNAEVIPADENSELKNGEIKETGVPMREENFEVKEVGKIKKEVLEKSGLNDKEKIEQEIGIVETTEKSDRF